MTLVFRLDPTLQGEDEEPWVVHQVRLEAQLVALLVLALLLALALVLVLVLALAIPS